MATLYHEYVEACFIVPLMRECYEVPATRIARITFRSGDFASDEASADGDRHAEGTDPQASDGQEGGYGERAEPADGGYDGSEGTGVIHIAEGTKERLKTELKRLQSMFGKGYSFSVVYLPDRIAYSQNGKLLRGTGDQNSSPLLR